jgi:serine/threonine-protein kinase
MALGEWGILADSVMTTTTTDPSSLEIFDQRYRLQRAIARVTNGGSVYAADHVYTQRTCAVKLLDANVRAIVRKRAMREMEALARVQGPGIVEFRDAGEVGGRLYIVMEFLDGRTLGGLLAAKGRLEIEDALDICSRIADVLARCHALGIVHRDVKPLNVQVSPTGAVHLMDFGIAKVIDPRAALERLTQENALLGTPEYMAPEALLASPDADHKVDQYALGVTMVECLTGVVPFEGSYGEVVKKMQSPMTPVRTLRPEVSEDLDRWIMRALRRDPDERFHDMDEMHAALRALVTRDRGAVQVPEARVAATIADTPGAKRPPTRRRHARAPYASLARIMRADRTSVDGRVEEISESGAQFVADKMPNSGETITLRFSLPISGRVIDLGAICRWTRATRVAMAAGFEFSSVPSDALLEIRKYVTLMGGE